MARRRSGDHSRNHERADAHGSGDADGPGVGEPLEAGGYVDPFPVDPVALHRDVAEVNTDAELHSPVKGARWRYGFQSRAGSRQRADRVKGTRKLGEEVSHRRIKHPATLLAD